MTTTRPLESSEEQAKPVHPPGVTAAVCVLTAIVLWPSVADWTDVRLGVTAAVLATLFGGRRAGWFAVSVVALGHVLIEPLVFDRPWSTAIAAGSTAVAEIWALTFVLGRAFDVRRSLLPARRMLEFVGALIGIAVIGGSVEAGFARTVGVDDPPSALSLVIGVAIAGGLAGLLGIRHSTGEPSPDRGQFVAPLVVVIMTLAAVQVTRQIGEQRDQDRLDRVAEVARSVFLEEVGTELTLASVKLDAVADALAADPTRFTPEFESFASTRSTMDVAALVLVDAAGTTVVEALALPDGGPDAGAVEDVLVDIDVSLLSSGRRELAAIEPATFDEPATQMLLFASPLPLIDVVTGSRFVVFGYDVPSLIDAGRQRSLDDVADVALRLDRVVAGRAEAFAGDGSAGSGRSASSDFAIGDQQYRFTARPTSTFGTDPGVMALILGLEAFFGAAILAVLLRGADSQFTMSLERRRRESLLEAALDATPGISVVFDDECRVLTANKSIRSKYSESIPGLPVGTLFGLEADSGREWLVRDAMLAALDGRPGHAELAEDNGDLGMRIMEIETYPVESADDVRVGFLHAVDATERRNLAMRSAQSERMESLGALAGGLAHDFNNLLFVTLGNLQLMAMNEVISQDDKLSKFVSRSMSAVERGAEITKSLLAVARSQPLEESTVSLADLVKGLLPLVRQALGAGRRVEVDIADPGLQLMVDSGRLSSCILNLAFNSRDAMGPTGTLTITGRLAEDPAMIELSVADDGAGMPAEVVARAFEPFFTTKSAGSGTGLGLATVYAFAKQSGGTAFLESRPGQGTTVTLVLPRYTGETTRSPAVVQRRAGRRVVVADDEQSLAEMVASWLIDMGIDARFATSPKSALELIEEFEPDVLVSDANFGEELDGIELARLGTAIVPEMAVVFMTGFSNSMRELQELGERTLAKPFSREDLHAALSPLIAEEPQDGTRTASEPSGEPDD